MFYIRTFKCLLSRRVLTFSQHTAKEGGAAKEGCLGKVSRGSGSLKRHVANDTVDGDDTTEKVKSEGAAPKKSSAVDDVAVVPRPPKKKFFLPAAAPAAGAEPSAPKSFERDEKRQKSAAPVADSESDEGEAPSFSCSPAFNPPPSARHFPPFVRVWHAIWFQTGTSQARRKVCLCVCGDGFCVPAQGLLRNSHWALACKFILTTGCGTRAKL
jgi:hypothetical protein